MTASCKRRTECKCGQPLMAPIDHKLGQCWDCQIAHGYLRRVRAWQLLKRYVREPIRTYRIRRDTKPVKRAMREVNRWMEATYGSPERLRKRESRCS